jgi:hypothetical protein
MRPSAISSEIFVPFYKKPVLRAFCTMLAQSVKGCIHVILLPGRSTLRDFRTRSALPVQGCREIPDMDTTFAWFERLTKNGFVPIDVGTEAPLAVTPMTTAKTTLASRQLLA